jgi:VanZ family protein
VPKKSFFKIAFVSWLVFISFSSLFSFSGMVKTSRFNIPHADKVVHFVFYFVLAFLGVLATKQSVKGNANSHNVLLYTFLFASFYGILMEFFQYYFTQNRQGDILDVLANTLGAMVGIFGVRWYLKKRRSLK